MSRVRVGLAAALLAVFGSCAPAPRPAPPPAPPPQRPATVRPPATTPPAPPPQWQDAPLSPCGWSHRGEGGVSAASFGLPGQASFTMRCEPGRQIVLARAGAGAAPAITVRTTSAVRSIPARAAGGSLTASVAASDPILDAIAFSRGRFTVEVAGMPTLILPAWPETARVIEDCRS